MGGKVLYLDSSALVHLIAPSTETPALYRLLGDWPERVSSALARVEVLRAVRRGGGTGAVIRRAEQVLERLALVRIDEAILDRAAAIRPPPLRSLDAIHLATALSLGRELGLLLTYDTGLAAAAKLARITVAPLR